VEGTRDFVNELLQVVDRHVLEVNLLSTVDVGGIGKNANRHPWPGDIWESTGEYQIRHIRRRKILAHLTVPEKRLSL